MTIKLSKRIVSFLTSLLLIISMVAYLPVMEASAESTTLGIVKVAADEIGTTERTAGSDDIKYNDWYYGYRVSNSYSGQYSWCAVFIAWCADQAGISTSVVPHKSVVTQYVQFYANIGRWHRVRASGWTGSSFYNDQQTADINYVPVQGDIVLFETNNNYTDGPDHIGLVDYQDGTYLYYIDGNNTSTTPHSVKYNKMSLSSEKIWGYCNPDYKPSIPNPDTLVVDNTYSSVLPLKAYLREDKTVYPCYSDCSTQTGGEIWSTDECTIREIYTNGWCKVEYPVSSGIKTAYTLLSNFIENSSLGLKITYTVPSDETTYIRSDLSSTYGYLEKGDNCYVVGSVNNTAQLIYPTDSGYKIGWKNWNVSVGVGKWITEGVDGDTVDEYYTGTKYYFWYKLVDTKTMTLLNAITNLYHDYYVKETIYYNNQVVGSYSYTNSDCNWIGCTLNNPGTYTFEIELSGNLTGTVTGTFEVKERTKDISTCTVSSIQNQYYTGSVIKPQIIVKDGSKTLLLNTDYTVTYSNNTNVGTAIVTITGIGTYTGSVEKNFTITCTHSYTSKVTKQPTCTATGIRTYTCSCGDSYTETIAAKGHSYTSTVVEPTHTEQGYVLHICSCGATYKDNYTNATGHKYTTKITKQPTCTATGIRTYTCSCGDSYTETIAAKGHSYTSTVVNINNPHKMSY